MGSQAEGVDFQALLKHFPEIDFAMAYGSGVFWQKGYDSGGPAPMIDLVFGVSDAEAFHTENLERNGHHYSSLARRCNGATIEFVQEGAAGLYYNTLVPMPEVEGVAPGQLMKYGVITTPTLQDDLLRWRTLYTSGRMHKPVKIVRCPPRLRVACDQNLLSALCAALLMLPGSFTDRELFMAIAGLSYTGDFRMTVGENPKKVSNIVDANKAHFHDLYGPLLEDMEQVGFVSFTKTILEQDTSPQARLELVKCLPSTLRHTMARRHQKWLHRRRMWSGPEPGDELHPGILRSMYQWTETCTRDPAPHLSAIARRSMARTVSSYSRSQGMKGILTAGFRKASIYSADKLTKMGATWAAKGLRLLSR